mmetsp:Transcript_34481/g.50057  ORF Transcript_34481/g.50057 Transcript_34481/m.50057 type:complete len:216 (+) Transcript_34481:853-1500(+)
MIATEQFQETSLRSSRSFYSSHGQVVNLKLNPLQIKQQILHPKRRSLAYSSKLRRLEVRETKGGQILVLLSKSFQHIERLYQLSLDKMQRLPNQDDIRVISNITTSSTQVDNGHGSRSNLTKRMYMTHHIVAELFLLLSRELKVNVVQLSLHLFQLLIGYFDPKFLLSSGEGQPEFAPGTELHRWRPYSAHFFRCVALHQRRFVLMVSFQSFEGK